MNVMAVSLFPDSLTGKRWRWNGSRYAAQQPLIFAPEGCRYSLTISSAIQRLKSLSLGS
ncbi:MAG: hypothetical protein AW06_001259 [Candidatus Accumulibacter cognatus]|uniref:Uncharacterized protein n=1 Tax=Candidatus Accumulibacter cognatus TaxID=2954383 RepID=A0A080M8R1_9PROT|nr:MAG: hypothetical protein AW06_001259 [Candidatus Accumulibacter cognatus]